MRLYIWVPKNFRESLTMPTAIFPKFLMGFCSDGPCECIGQIVKAKATDWPKLHYCQIGQAVALAVPERIAIAVLGWVANPQFLGRKGRRGTGVVPFERAFVTSYRPSIVTFPLSLHVSEILPLLCSSTPLFPTPPL